MSQKYGQSDGLDWIVLYLFQLEVELQCRVGLMAYADLRVALQECLIPSFGFLDTETTVRVWGSLQAFLGAAANVSKLLWCGEEHLRKYPEVSRRREQLRASLLIDDTSPLQDRTLRNDFEHFDARLDEWIAGSDHIDPIDLFLGSPSLLTAQGQERRNLVRVFDPDTETVTTPTETFPIGPIRDALADLIPRAAARTWLPA